LRAPIFGTKFFRRALQSAHGIAALHESLGTRPTISRVQQLRQLCQSTTDLEPHCADRTVATIPMVGSSTLPLIDLRQFNGLAVSLMSHTRKLAKRPLGYARVSTEAQDLTRQRQALKAYGCKLIFEDRASGRSLAGRPELARALDELRPGDCLVLAEWDRATRSMWDGLHIVKQVLDAGATIKVLDFPSLDLATPEGRGFLAMFSAMAERERLRIVARTREGRRIAMGKGVKMGPPFKLTEHQRNLAAKRMASGESTRQIARDFNVSHNTVARLR
jgi:DNA invertase Pin-like site-specific DNA recombinase